jgi:hypothetical protein
MGTYLILIGKYLTCASYITDLFGVEEEKPAILIQLICRFPQSLQLSFIIKSSSKFWFLTQVYIAYGFADILKWEMTR